MKQKSTDLTLSPSLHEQFNELVSKIPHDNLQHYIMDHAIANPLFAHELLAEYTQFNRHETPELYRQQVRCILNKASDKDGFISWNTVGDAGASVGAMFFIATRHLKAGHHRTVIRICCAILDEVIPALRYADDDGELGDNVSAAFEMLVDIAPLLNDEEVRKELFNFCISRYRQQAYKGWSWHEGMMEIASALCSSDIERDELIRLSSGS